MWQRVEWVLRQAPDGAGFIRLAVDGTIEAVRDASVSVTRRPP